MEHGQQKTRAFIVPKQSQITIPVGLTWDQFLRITDLFTAGGTFHASNIADWNDFPEVVDLDNQ